MQLNSIRNLEYHDYNKQYLDLLKYLSYCHFSDDKKKWDFFYFQNFIKNDNHHIFVIEDLEANIIVASITLLIESKVIRNFSFVAHIEDLIVHKDYRKLGLAHQLINYCIDISKNHFSCYKIILNCDESLKSFYENYSFKQKNIEMSLYFHIN